MDTNTTTKVKPRAVTSQHDGARHHKVLTAATARSLPPLGSTDGFPNTERKFKAKLFSPYTGWRWYVVEYDGTAQAFGFVTSPICPEGEWGFFDLQELADLNKNGLPLVEADKWWDPTTVAAVLDGSVR